MTPSTPNAGADPRMVSACIAGDEGATRALYRHYQDMVRRVLVRTLGQHPDLEDLVQESFVNVFQSLPRFKGRSSLKTFIYRVTVNVALMHLRAEGRRSAREEAFVQQEELGHVPADDPEGAVLREERARRIRELVLQLPPKKRVALVLREAEGLEPSEVAKVLGVPAVTVRTRLYYARKELLKLVQADSLLATAPGGTP